jgi:hypothetical protein
MACRCLQGFSVRRWLSRSRVRCITVLRMDSNRYLRHRFCLALVISLLFCGLSSLEFPEFVNLTDDTSNDFTLVVSAQAAPSARSDEKPALDATATQERKERADRFVQVPVRITPAPSPSGYLQLLCISRT